MSKIEIERFVAPYEFEDRANFFMADVVLIEKDFPDLLVDVVNKTLLELEANTWAIKTSAKKQKLSMYQKALERGIEKDILSKTENVVTVSIHGAKRARIEAFKQRLEESAKKFNGEENDEDSNLDPNPDSEYKYFTNLDYIFRG